jgi:hypothetical protein
MKKKNNIPLKMLKKSLLYDYSGLFLFVEKKKVEFWCGASGN